MCDIVVGLQYGDEGKGKVVHNIIQNNNYTHCVRFNGGPNAGHTIYHNGKKIVTHQIPTGILYGLVCVIGPNCVVDINKLEKEIQLLEDHNLEVRSLLKISYNAHIITEEHIYEDITNDKVGSTKSGIRPAYRDKYDRRGTRAVEIGNICGCEIVNSYKILNQPNIKVLFEGAQGFMLDINWGNYPYVTSSGCLSSDALSCGMSYKTVNEVYGVAKLYNTYVGKMLFQPEDPLLDTLCEIGQEYGSTTGRKRQCDWLNLNELERAVIINGVTHLIINKCDIIRQLGEYKLYHNGNLVHFYSFNKMKYYIDGNLNVKITFSFNKDKI